MYKFIFLLLISSPAYADWSDADTKREAVYMTLHALDWAQTRNIARNPDRWIEKNNILGEHPSVGRVNNYFVATAALQFAIAHYLPAEYRKAFQYLSIGHDAGYVLHNYSIGVSARF